MTKSQIKQHQRRVTAVWLEQFGGVNPPRERIVYTMAARGYRGRILPNRARRWAAIEPMRLKTAY